MPRPKEGYRNSAGEIIPGTTEVCGRYKDSSRLLYWAFNRGKQGLKALYDNSEINIGTCVHMMCELSLKGDTAENIQYYLNATLRDPEHREKATIAFESFCRWREKFHVEPHTQELSLVSEKHQFGGTPDTIAHVRNGLGLIDFKTSAKGEVYEDHVIQLAAYSLLWQECKPNLPLSEGAHLILLPKDGARPVHKEYSWAHLEPYRRKFLLFRQAYELEKLTANPQALAGLEVAPSIAPEKPAAPARKPRAKVEAISYRDMSLAEIMRANGLLRGERVPA